MQTSRPFFRGKAFFTCIMLLCLFSATYVFRHPLMIVGTKFCLGKTFPKNLSYQDISAYDGKVILQGVHLLDDRYQLTIESIEFTVDLQKILYQPKKVISYLKGKRSAKQGLSHWIQGLHTLKQYGMNFDIENGILQLEGQRYYFNFKGGDKHYKIGTLSVSHDPGLIRHPFLVAHLQMRGSQILAQMQIEEVASERFLYLAAFAFSEQLGGFEGAQGIAKLDVSAIFEEDGQIAELSTRFDCRDFEVYYPKSACFIQMKSLHGDLIYPEGVENIGLPVWKQMLSSLVLEKGNLKIGDSFALSNLDGNIALDPREDPALFLSGELSTQESPLALELEGKGAIHEDQAYWLEFGLNLDDRLGTHCAAFFSICRPEQGSLVLQLEANHLLPEQVEMFKGSLARSLPRLSDWKIDQGIFGGKLIVLFDEGNLSHFEIQDLSGENVVLQGKNQTDPLFFSSIKGEGRLVGWRPRAIGELTLSLDLPVSHLLQFASSKLKTAYEDFRPDDIAYLTSTITFSEKEVETLASVDFDAIDQSLQFGFTSPSAFPNSLLEIKRGWARSQRLDHMFYGPFVRLFSEDLEVYGDVDLLATYNGNTWDFALQIDQFLTKHPLLDLKAQVIGDKTKTLGRAKISFDPKTNFISGTLPLKDSFAYDRQSGLFFQEVDGKVALSITNEGMTLDGLISKAHLSFDETDLIDNAGFLFSLDRENKAFIIKDAKGDLALPTDKTYSVADFAMDASSVSLCLLDGKKELAQLHGKKEKNWEGQLKLNSSMPIEGEFALQCDFDPINSLGILTAKGEDHTITLKKEGKKYLIEELIFGDYQCRGAFTKAEKGFAFSTFQVQRPDLSLQGSGNLYIDLPTKESTFSVRSDLQVEAELLSPVPMQIQSAHPFKMGYTPQMGLVLSNIDLNVSGSHLSIDHFENLFTSKKLAAHNCSFTLKQPLLSSLIDAKMLPDLMRDFRFCKELHGKLNALKEKGRWTLAGNLQDAALWKTEGNRDLDISIILEPKQEDGRTCSIIMSEHQKEEGLAIDANLNEKGLRFHSIKGTLGRLSADLKCQKMRTLKGIVKLDFSLFDQLFDIPLNRYLQLWKAGSGYEFEGVFIPGVRLADWAFNGKIKGHGFECGGYELRSLEAKVQVHPGEITFENLDLTDDAGKMWIGEGTLTRAPHQSHWDFHFPLVEVRGFQPSFLHQLKGPEKPITPLVVKSATIHDVRGKIDDPNSLSGYGMLRFTNQSRSERSSHPQRLSPQVLERMGLDEELFVPAKGEIDYIIQEGRCYLQQLRGVYSSGNRSEFLIPKNGIGGYLDFMGNFAINLQVKQKVNTSISSPISLQVRGTWQEPELSIR